MKEEKKVIAEERRGGSRVGLEAVKKEMSNITMFIKKHKEKQMEVPEKVPQYSHWRIHSGSLKNLRNQELKSRGTTLIKYPSIRRFCFRKQ